MGQDWFKKRKTEIEGMKTDWQKEKSRARGLRLISSERGEK